MHLNASGRSRVNGNRPADPGKRAAEQGVQGAPQAGTRDGASQSRHRKLHPCNSRISLEFREVGLPRPRRWSSIWSFPEPPIEFLLVGTRRTAKYGKESRLRNADVAQLVEHHLAKVDVASSNLVVRSQDTVTAKIPGSCFPEAMLTRWVGREARQRPAKPYTRVRIPYPPR
jgi:hypothetical protein